MLPPEVQAAWDGLAAIFQRYPKPTSVRGCKCPSCLREDQILALLDTDPRQLEATGEVRTYVFNALRTIGEVDDLTYLFPGLARLWAEKVNEGDSSDAYREHFWFTMRQESFLAEKLTDPYKGAASAFLRTAILARLAREDPLHQIKGISGPHLWTEEVDGLAQASDDFPLLWNEWWEMPTVGHARVALQYASCLVFTATDNPLFHRWTRLEGGGPPLSFESPGQFWIYWRDANLSFIKSRLTMDFLIASLERACKRLEDPKEIHLGEGVLDALRRSPEIVTSRVKTLTSG